MLISTVHIRDYCGTFHLHVSADTCALLYPHAHTSSFHKSLHQLETNKEASLKALHHGVFQFNKGAFVFLYASIVLLNILLNIF